MRVVLFQAVLILISFSLIVCANNDSENNDICAKTTCFILTRTNVSSPIVIKDVLSNRTIFCFEGLEHSIRNLWSNSMLHINREKSSPNEKSVFLTFYGTSVSSVEFYSQQQSYRMFQEWIAMMRSLKTNEDISLEPFGHTCIKIESNLRYSAEIKIKSLDYWYLVYLAIGVIIFFSAKTLSKNTTLHYGTGVFVGMVASLLILMFILTRFIPSRLKNIWYLLMLFGTPVCTWLFSNVLFHYYSSEHFIETFIATWQYIVGYFIVMGVISFVVVYRYGPVTNQRSLNLVQWFLQAIGLLLVYNSTQIREVSVAMIFVLLVAYSFPRISFKCQTASNIWHRLFPHKIELLTEDEYIRQGKIETQKALEQLREYCRSPDCHTWKVVSKLKNPLRFAEFVMRDSWHESYIKAIKHDFWDDPVSHYEDTFSDTGSELVFVLGNPSMTVQVKT